MQQIVGEESWCTTAQLRWKEAKRKILDQGLMESEHKAGIRRIFDEARNDGKEVYNQIAVDKITWFFYIADEHLIAVMLLPYLLPDVRSIPSYERVIYFTKVKWQLQWM